MSLETKKNLIRRFIVSVCITCFTAGLLASTTIVTAQAEKLPASKITVIADGSEWEYVTNKQSVKDVLHETGIILHAKDRVVPTLKTKIKNDLKIRVIRISEEIIKKTEPIPYKVKTKFDNSSSAQSKTVLTNGKNGERQVKIMATYKDGQKIHTKVLSSKVTTAPVNEVVAISKSAFLTSRSGMKLPSIRMTATAYDPGPRSCGPRATGRTAMGLRAGHGIAAVDPRVIKLGTKLYVEGYGFCIAGDTGGAIKGNKIDLCFNTYNEAKRYGRRKVTVYILD